MNRIRSPFFLALLFLLLFSAGSVLAQDSGGMVTNTPGELSVVPVDASPVADEAAATTAVVPGDSPVVIHVEQPDPADAVTIARLQATIDSQQLRMTQLEAAAASPMPVMERLLLWGVIVVLGYIVLSSNKSLKEMVSADSARGFYKDANDSAMKMAGQTSSKLDDIVVQLFSKRIEALINGMWGPEQPAPAPASSAAVIGASGDNRTHIQETA